MSRPPPILSVVNPRSRLAALIKLRRRRSPSASPAVMPAAMLVSAAVSGLTVPPGFCAPPLIGHVRPSATSIARQHRSVLIEIALNRREVGGLEQRQPEQHPRLLRIEA